MSGSHVNKNVLYTVNKIVALFCLDCCHVPCCCFFQDQILRKPNGLAWVLFTDTASVERAVECYYSGQAFMYGTPFVISAVVVDVIADGDTEEIAEARARSVCYCHAFIHFNSIQFNFYFSHVQRDSVQYIKNNKHLYYKGGLKRIRINLFSLV